MGFWRAPHKRSLQQYAETRRNTQKRPSKDFLHIEFQRLQKHAGGYERKPSNP